MTRRRWVLHDLNSRFNCLNPRYNVGTPSFAPVDDYADENPKERDDAASASDRHEAWDRDPAEAHARLQRDARAEQQAESYGQKGVAEQSLLERSCHMRPRPLLRRHVVLVHRFLGLDTRNDAERAGPAAPTAPDVQRVRVPRRRLAVVGGELVRELLQSSVVEAAHGEGRVALSLDEALEVLDGVLLAPVVDDFDVALIGHVNVLVRRPN